MRIPVFFLDYLSSDSGRDCDDSKYGEEEGGLYKHLAHHDPQGTHLAVDDEKGDKSDPGQETRDTVKTMRVPHVHFRHRTLQIN